MSNKQYALVRSSLEGKIRFTFVLETKANVDYVNDLIARSNSRVVRTQFMNSEEMVDNVMKLQNLLEMSDDMITYHKTDDVLLHKLS